MRVKVLMLPEHDDDKPGKVEYFNDIDHWDTDGRILHLYKAERGYPVATVQNWTWVKEDE
jgi:hypothetical protein